VGTPNRVIRDYRHEPEKALTNRNEIIATETGKGRVFSCMGTNKGVVIPPYYPRLPIPAGDPLSPGGTQVTLEELADDVLNAIIAGAGASARKPFIEVDVLTALIPPGDVFDIQTGSFSVAGAQALYSSFGTPVLPVSGSEFRDDTRVQMWLNGVVLSKSAGLGGGRDVYYVSTSSVAFEMKIRKGDLIRVESLTAF